VGHVAGETPGSPHAPRVTAMVKEKDRDENGLMSIE
jgi:hypothetical protein